MRAAELQIMRERFEEDKKERDLSRLQSQKKLELIYKRMKLN